MIKKLFIPLMVFVPVLLSAQELYLCPDDPYHSLCDYDGKKIMQYDSIMVYDYPGNFYVNRKGKWGLVEKGCFKHNSCIYAGGCPDLVRHKNIALARSYHFDDFNDFWVGCRFFVDVFSNRAGFAVTFLKERVIHINSPMKLIVFIFSALLCKAGVSATIEKYISIHDLAQTNRLKATVKGLGGYSGNCIQINLANQVTDTLFIKLEAGRRLVSEDTVEQDIFVVKEQLLVLAPKQKKSIEAFGFCCESNKHSPGLDSKFSLGYMAPPAWVELAHFLAKGNYDLGAMQHAVWVLSNKHQISSVSGSDQQKTSEIRRELARLTGAPVPWYTLEYVQLQDRVFSDQHSRFTGPVDFSLREMDIITIQVRNETGIIMAVPLQAGQYMNGNHTYMLDVPVKGWKKGKYNIYVFQGGMRKIAQKEFVL